MSYTIRQPGTIKQAPHCRQASNYSTLPLKPRNKGNHFSLDMNQCHPYKESPYRLYGSPQQTLAPLNVNSQVVYSNFTLGEDHGQENIDPDYNFMEATPRLEIKEDTEEIEDEEEEDTALKEAEWKLKARTLKVRIEGLRYHNHYRKYFEKLVEFMVMPPYPILHSDRNKDISFRLDPPEDGYLNEFPLLQEMFKSRGGVHYIRKVFNWSRSRQIQASPDQISVMFINIELSKHQFESLCGGNYTKINEALQSRHTLNQQPSSFTCYHILARLSLRDITKWGCLYLIEAVHL